MTRSILSFTMVLVLFCPAWSVAQEGDKPAGDSQPSVSDLQQQEEEKTKVEPSADPPTPAASSDLGALPVAPNAPLVESPMVTPVAEMSVQGVVMEGVQLPAAPIIMPSQTLTAPSATGCAVPACVPVVCVQRPTCSTCVTEPSVPCCVSCEPPRRCRLLDRLRQRRQSRSRAGCCR